MKIVISANTSWYIYNFRRNTILTLIENDYHVIVVSPKDEYSDKLVELGADFKNIIIQRDGTNPIKDLFTCISFYFLYKKLSPNLVLNFTPKNNIYSTIAAKLLKIKVINNIAGLGTVFVNETFVSKIARFLYKVSQPHADVIFFQNDDDRTIFLENRITTEDKTERLPGSGVDLTRFEIQKSNNDGVTRFLLVARMLYEKGISYYADAAEILKAEYGGSVEFYLLGFIDDQNPKGISSKKIDEWVKGGWIIYKGTSDAVEKEIALVDCVVLPSFYREGVPKSLLEAGAMGKPIITTDNVGCRETVDDSINGYLCQSRSLDSLLKAMRLIIDMTYDERLAMGIKSRQKMEENFDEKVVISKYLHAIKKLIP
nr:glycosyltransferase family 4 protein [Erwinia rhapontici]